MNTRLLYVVLAALGLFGAGLIAVGTRARDDRRIEYLELTHRITSGQASMAELAQAASLLPPMADAQTVRALLGIPLRRFEKINVEGEHEPRTGNFWLYYPAAENGEMRGDRELAQLNGAVKCLVVAFDEKGRASAEMLSVVHAPAPAK